MPSTVPNVLTTDICLAGVVLVSWASTHSSSYEVCEQERYSSGTETVAFNKEIAYFLVCEGVTIDSNGELLTALGTIAIAVFTLTLWLVTGHSVRLAREEFIAANPPHLVMRNVTSRNGEVGDTIAISFDLINIGRANAKIVASTFRTDFVEETETFHDLMLPAVGEPPRNVLGPMVIKAKAVLRRTVTFPRKWQADHFHDHGIAEAGFFFSAKILYRDPDENQRRLGVMRRLALPSRRFRSVNDPEFEYDD